MSSLEEHSMVTFNNNIAQSSSWGAFTCYNSNVTIKGNSNVIFNSNMANQDGGAIYSYNVCHVTFKSNSTSTLLQEIIVVLYLAVSYLKLHLREIQQFLMTTQLIIVEHFTLLILLSYLKGHQQFHFIIIKPNKMVELHILV